MKVHTTELFDAVIKRNLYKYSHLRIISGYGSSSFLEKIIGEFPLVNIELYIGMAKEGIPINDHLKYKLLTSDRIRIFYNVTNQFNHMKIYEFSNELNEVYYVGSANFSDNGFFKNEEILVEVEEDLTFVFNQQSINMLNCIDPKIEKIVHFTETKVDEVGIQKPKAKVLKKLEDYKDKIVNMYFRRFKLPIVLPPTSDKHWRVVGINRYPSANEEPVIRQTPQHNFIELFPTGKNIIIYSYDGWEIEAKLTGDFYNEIQFLDFNIYSYLQEKVGLDDVVPISYNQLKNKGIETLNIARLNETEYYFTLLKE